MLDPKDWDTYNNRAVVHADQDRWGAAVADCTKALELKPDLRSRACFNRGIARIRQGDEAGGEADKARAAELDPRFKT